MAESGVSGQQILVSPNGSRKLGHPGAINASALEPFDEIGGSSNADTIK